MDFIDEVAEFNAKVLNVQDREKSLLNEAELKYAAKAIKEELAEFEQAHEQQDFISAVDAVTDLIYFAYGFLFRMGLTAAEARRVGSIVHGCNMAKKLGHVAKRCDDGSVADAVKPEGWTGPEELIAEALSN